MKFTNKELKLIEETKQRLKNSQSNSDTEIAHVEADDALCTLLTGLGLESIVEEFEEVNKWYA